MREVADGVYEVPILHGFVNVFLIVGDAMSLVDAGLPGRAGEVTAAVKRIGRDHRDITTIAVTHHHVDHIGALAALQRLTGARVCTSGPETGIVRGDRAAPRLVSQSPYWGVLLSVAERLGPTQAKPAPIHQVLDDGDQIEGSGLTAILSPGHTVGHVSYLYTASGTLFVGDAAATSLRGHLRLPVADHDEDPIATIASIGKLANLDSGTACFGHGRSISDGAGPRLSEFHERLMGPR